MGKNSTSSKRSGRKIPRDLKRKSLLVRWEESSRNEIYGLVARKIDGKAGLREKSYLAFDLEDLEEAINK